MIRSMAASMNPSRSTSGKFGGFEPGNGLVGDPDLVEFAALEHLYDDFKQPFVAREIVRHGAAAAKIVRGDGISVAHRIEIHDLQSAFDQHGLEPPLWEDKPEGGKKFQFARTVLRRPKI